MLQRVDLTVFLPTTIYGPWVNLTARRATIIWREGECHAADLLTAFGAEGFSATIVAP